MTSSTALEQTGALAADILDDARMNLQTSLRFMDVALWRMPFAPRRMRFCVGTDGRAFYFDALPCVCRYRESADELVRDYLHAILHCVFGHPFEAVGERADLFDVACDMSVEAAALELVGARWKSDDDARRADWLKRFLVPCRRLTARRIFKFLLRCAEDPEQASCLETHLDVAMLAELFARDDHSVWLRGRTFNQAHLKIDNDVELLQDDGDQRVKGSGAFEEDEDDDDISPSSNSDGAAAKSIGGIAAEGEVENGDRFSALDSEQEAQSQVLSMADVAPGDFEGIDWKDISKLIQMDMETFSGKIGSDAGTFMVNLQVANRKEYDYRDFLKRFASRCEEMKVNPDEFDYIFYTYGLKLYENMPLIEPLEYLESNRVREFVIAIDTSASCSGGLVKRFVEKTYDVLKSTGGFGRKINVHIIQCDCDVRGDIHVTESSGIDERFGDFSTKGFGGTDFRPVFKYVDGLVKNRELANLKGLLYLTDGLGKFPDKAPEYETAFVFLDEDHAKRSVPAWAMKVVIDEDQIYEL